MSNLPLIDILLLILILLMVVHGFVKGFIAELFSWAALVLSIWAAVLLFPAGAAFLRKSYMQNVRLVPEIIAFVVIFVLIMLFIKFLERILRDVIEEANLGTVNKLLGAVFGLIEGFALTALIIFVFAVQPLFDASKLIGESIFSGILLPFITIPLNRGKDIINTAFLILPGIRFSFFRYKQSNV
jgi:membrane protein required for colicin V production